jgi:hypothetical protein
MSFATSMPEGLKLLECEQGVGGKSGIFLRRMRPLRKPKRPTTSS